jgi:hypothetical protein
MMRTELLSHDFRDKWLRTKRYGDVFVSPVGMAWGIKRHGDKLKSSPVKIFPCDIVEVLKVRKE